MINSLGFFKESCCNISLEYEKYKDEELIDKIRMGDNIAEKCLYTKYAFIVRKMVSSFFLIGGETDDLFQEAMIGLINAVNNYDYKINDCFRYFALLCMRRQIISAIRKSKVYEKNLLNNSISICQFTNYEYEKYCSDNICLDKFNPENVVICKEEINNYYRVTDEILSQFEKQVLMEYSKGKTYNEISISLRKDMKSIDNALQRIKSKVKNIKKI